MNRRLAAVGVGALLALGVGGFAVYAALQTDESGDPVRRTPVSSWSDDESGEPLRRTPVVVACGLLRSGVPQPEIEDRLLAEFYPGEPGYGERPDVEILVAINRARDFGCDR